jgi:hypothetical protein
MLVYLPHTEYAFIRQGANKREERKNYHITNEKHHKMKTGQSNHGLAALAAAAAAAQKTPRGPCPHPYPNSISSSPFFLSTPSHHSQTDPLSPPSFLGLLDHSDAHSASGELHLSTGGSEGRGG